MTPEERVRAIREAQSRGDCDEALRLEIEGLTQTDNGPKEGEYEVTENSEGIAVEPEDPAVESDSQ